MQTFRLQKTIQTDGEIHLTNLPLMRGQKVELVFLFDPETQPKKKRLTARGLLESELIGLWRDRTDITDSVVYARQLREQAQRRRHDYFG